MWKVGKKFEIRVIYFYGLQIIAFKMEHWSVYYFTQHAAGTKLDKDDIYFLKS